MMSNISNFLWSIWEIAVQLPNDYCGVAEEPEPKLFYETMAQQQLIKTANQWVPKDVIEIILRNLSPKELLKVGLVCKLWQQVASKNSLWRPYHLNELCPLAPVIDRSVWDACVDLKKHGLVIEEKGRPCVESKRHYFDLLRMASEVEDGQGISILTLPKGLSLNKIVAFATAPKKGNATQFGIPFPNEKLGDVELQETITVAISNGIFQNSREQNVAEQIKLVKSLKCEMPQVVAITALILLKFISWDPNHRLRLFGFFPGTLTRCMEKVGGDQVIVGGFTEEGPQLRADNSAGLPYGVGGQRKFAVNNPLEEL